MIENETPPAPGAEKLIQRDSPDVDESRAALVKRWLDDIAVARRHWKPDFDRMRRNMKFASGKQWPNQKENDDRYRVNLVQRVLKASVSSLYAKNPTVVHKRRELLDFKMWDGSPETLMQAQQTIAQAQAMLTGDPGAAEAAGNPQQFGLAEAAVQTATALLQDVQQGVERRKMVDKVGKTLSTTMQYYIGEGIPSFKTQMKQMVRRTRTTGIGYVKLGFQREMELSERQTTEIADHAERLAAIGRMSADLADGELDPNAAAAEELRLAIATLQSEPDRIIREGLVFDFPGSTKIIPSLSTQKLVGWVGSEWVAEEIMLSPDRIKEAYGVDIGSTFASYRTITGSPEGGDTRRIADKRGGLACVYHVYDKRTGMELVVCEGYPDFLKEPGSPAIFIEQFFPYFAVTFNDGEDEGRLFFDSDVENLTHPQKDFNRAKEARRQHRIANRPLYAAPKGAFEEDEEKTLSDYPAHSVIELNGLEKGRPITDLIQPVNKIGVDPNLYETSDLFGDMQHVTGFGEMNLGGTAGATATESNIAQSSLNGSIGLDSDDLDEMLTALFRAGGQVLLMELDAQTVARIAGIGAVWPELSRQEIAEEMWLEAKAGSSGRPNQAEEAARFERMYPLLVQVPGVTPRWLAERALSIADDNVSLEDAFVEGMQSITAMNQRQQPGTGDPATDPEQQGGRGGDPQKTGQQRDNGQATFNAGPQK